VHGVSVGREIRLLSALSAHLPPQEEGRRQAHGGLPGGPHPPRR